MKKLGLFLLLCLLFVLTNCNVWFPEETVVIELGVEKYQIIKCYADVCKDSCKFTWQKNGTVLANDIHLHELIDSDETIVLKPPLRKQHLGRYSCSVADAQKTVGTADVNVMEGRTKVTLKEALQDGSGHALLSVMSVFYILLTGTLSGITYLIVRKARKRNVVDENSIESQIRKVSKGMPPIKLKKTFNTGDVDHKQSETEDDYSEVEEMDSDYDNANSDTNPIESDLENPYDYDYNLPENLNGEKQKENPVADDLDSVYNYYNEGYYEPLQVEKNNDKNLDAKKNVNEVSAKPLLPPKPVHLTKVKPTITQPLVQEVSNNLKTINQTIRKTQHQTHLKETPMKPTRNIENHSRVKTSDLKSKPQVSPSPKDSSRDSPQPPQIMHHHKNHHKGEDRHKPSHQSHQHHSSRSG